MELSSRRIILNSAAAHSRTFVGKKKITKKILLRRYQDGEGNGLLDRRDCISGAVNANRDQCIEKLQENTYSAYRQAYIGARRGPTQSKCAPPMAGHNLRG